MPDHFFTSSKSRKRKRVESGGGGATSTKKSRKGFDSRKFATNGKAKVNGKNRKNRDEELSDQTDDYDGGVDDMDLRPGIDVDVEVSGEEDEEETPAEKRLRLAKLYLDSVKESLGKVLMPLTSARSHTLFFFLVLLVADGEFDAAEIDKELISARLKQDVMEHSGKVHLFIADLVYILFIFILPINSKH